MTPKLSVYNNANICFALNAQSEQGFVGTAQFLLHLISTVRAKSWGWNHLEAPHSCVWKLLLAVDWNLNYSSYPENHMWFLHEAWASSQDGD